MRRTGFGNDGSGEDALDAAGSTEAVASLERTPGLEQQSNGQIGLRKEKR
jgi:hypothetical protein